MWTSALVIGALTVAAAASEMDPTPTVSEVKTAIQPAAQNNPNVIVVKVDENRETDEPHRFRDRQGTRGPGRSRKR